MVTSIQIFDLNQSSALINAAAVKMVKAKLFFPS